MKSVVTGGAGFIGSHIVDALVNLGQEVEVIDNESSPVHEQFYHNEQAKYHCVDVADYDSTLKIIQGADYVFHLAAEARIQPSIGDPLRCVKTNALGTATVLEASRQAGIKRLIYSSTSSAYGRINPTPFQETMAADCLNPYSAAKVFGEKMCKVYSELYGLDTVVFRYFNVYGAREPIQGPYAPIVGLFLRQWRAKQALTIVPNGQQRRDFTHVSDVVQANILAATSPNFQGRGEIFNVGTGKNYSILELAAMISPQIKFIDPRPGEAQITLANNNKIQQALGWAPQIKLEDYILDCMKA